MGVPFWRTPALHRGRSATRPRGQWQWFDADKLITIRMEVLPSLLSAVTWGGLCLAAKNLCSLFQVAAIPLGDAGATAAIVHFLSDPLMQLLDGRREVEV